MKAYSPACERNRAPILAVLKVLLNDGARVLEIGSGTGQHAVHFASALPRVTWQPTDVVDSLASISAYRDEAGLANLRAPFALDLEMQVWPASNADAIVCINTIHIVSWPNVERLFARAGEALPEDGILYVYGPFRYAGKPLEPSNQEFDRWLKARDPHSGVRDFDAVAALAVRAGLDLAGDRPMPANNRSIWWRKRTRPLGFQ
ncbi:MAG: class I SAM-dependent methyltransferase [Gammaproteobacteria bacterium]|nr:class I SAM-dependent methyltransferase [Gammaproteobacteria bacterium]